MATTMNRAEFRKAFTDQAVVIQRLVPGPARDLAARVNTLDGDGDASLRTRAEHDVLFDVLHEQLDDVRAPDLLTVARADGQLTAVGDAIAAYGAAAFDAGGLFAEPLWMVHVTGWPRDEVDQVIERPRRAPRGARVACWPLDPSERRHLPPEPDGGAVLASRVFALENTGNRTLRASKRSWRIELDNGPDEDRFVGLERINFKAMHNDPSQMREALAWRLFARCGVVASRHTYARFAIDERYLGLFSMIEDVDRRFLKDRFGRNDEGNLYKAACGSLGCATLEHRSRDGDDSGRQYRTDDDDETYRLRTNKDVDKDVDSHEDLAQFIRTINGVGLSGDERFATDAFRAGVEQIMNVWALLRWAGANLLLGSWDNYFATPSNYYLYNSGRRGAHHDVVSAPYFTFIPWDYDNCLGIDYFGARWQETDLLDWPSNTAAYQRFNRRSSPRSRIPLVEHLLAHPDFIRYYLDHIEYLLETDLTTEAMLDTMLDSGPSALWSRVAQSAFLESDTPHGRPFTGRQFTNDQVYWSGFAQHELARGSDRIDGIVHYVRMRRDSAAAQLSQLRRRWPRGSSGVTFPVDPEPLPS